MKDSDSKLNDILRKARLPERPPEYWEDFPRLVRRRLPRPGQHSPRRQAHSWRLALGTGLAAACLILVFFFAPRPERPAPIAQAGTPEFNEQLFQEIASLFPNRIQFIAIDGNEIRLQLSERPDVPDSPPVWLRVCKSGRCKTYITFSGQRIPLNGESVEVLTTAADEILVVGRDLAWSSGESLQVAMPVRIEAGMLEAAL